MLRAMASSCSAPWVPVFSSCATETGERCLLPAALTDARGLVRIEVHHGVSTVSPGYGVGRVAFEMAG